MKYSKKIIIAVGIFFSVLLLSLSLIQISFNIIYPGNELAESIKDNFKDSFGKSIKFDSLVFRYNGDIVLQNFYLSNNTDFNDNVNLIKCNEVIIDTSLIDLLIKRKITFSALVMYKPDISIIKNYGKTYTDTFINDIVSGFKNDKASHFITKDFSIELKNSKLYYREIFKKTKTSIDFYDVDVDIDYFENGVEYALDGKIINSNLHFWNSCGFDVEGKVSFSESDYENRIKFYNTDISIINNLISEKLDKQIIFSGNLSGDLNIETSNNMIHVKGEIEGDKMYTAVAEEGETRYILKKENITLNADISASLAMDRIIITRLEFDDDILKLNLKSEYIKDEHLSAILASDRIDLSELSYRFIPVEKCRYNGNLSLYGKINYNFKDLKPEEIALDIKLNNFNLEPVNALNGESALIKNCSGFITADKDKYLIKAQLVTGVTDLDISFNGQTSEWNPFKSRNTIHIKSDQIELALIKKAVLSGINTVYNMAYVDMFQNFDEQRNFLKEPEGIFLNNNDLNIKIEADKVLIINNAAFDNLDFELKLEKGIVKTEHFAMDGYDGVYSFNMYAVLRQEYPFIRIEGGVDNLNISRISAASDFSLPAGGILSSDFKFETNAFRIGQIVENGRGAINLGIKDGYITGTGAFKKLKDFIDDQGFADTLPDPLAFSSFDLTFSQSSNEFYIKNFRMSGNRCSFSSYGKYLEDEGLSVPVTLNLVTENKYSKVPLMITGDLLTPCIRINDKKQKDSICFN